MFHTDHPNFTFSHRSYLKAASRNNFEHILKSENVSIDINEYEQKIIWIL